MRRYLKVNFQNISDAEEAYNINYFQDDELFKTQQDVTSTPVSSSQVRGYTLGSPMLAFSPLKNAEDRKLPGSILDVVSSGFVELTKRQRQQLLVHLFHKWLKLDVHEELNSTYVPHDFLPLLSSAVRVLFVNEKNNLLYDAARCFGVMRPGEDCPRMPLSRMPFGLISHNLRFFASDNVSNLEAPPDYKSWYQSMYTLFGNKWAALHNGPMWSYIGNNPNEVESEPSADQQSDILTQALQETFECNSELLQELVTETSAAPVPTSNLEVSPVEPLRNVEVPEVSSVAPNLSGSSSETPASSLPRSTLWSSLSESQIREDEGSTLTETELGEIHGIVPTSSQGAGNVERHALKVSVLVIKGTLMAELKTNFSQLLCSQSLLKFRLWLAAVAFLVATLASEKLVKVYSS